MSETMTFKEIRAKAEAMKKKYDDELEKATKGLEEATAKRAETEALLENFSGTPEEYADLYTRLSAFKEYESLMRTKRNNLINPNAKRDTEYTELCNETKKAIRENKKANIKWMRKLSEKLLKEIETKTDEEEEIFMFVSQLRNSICISNGVLFFREQDTITNALSNMVANAKGVLENLKETE